MYINKVTLTHIGGHYVPSKKEYYKEFITDMTLQKNKRDD